jgi:hypothetical protein
MLDRARVEEAVELQRRSYELMVWLGQAVRRGFVSFDTAHEYATAQESARDWILEHWANIPPRCRPTASKGPPLTRFANVFTSYMETSFELVEKPGKRLHSGCGCMCPCCAYLVAVPHLQPKRVGAPDKKRARTLARAAIEEIARDTGGELPREMAEAMLDDRSLKESAALVAYAAELFRRCDGSSTGHYVLALWRMFAWKPAGSPNRDFVLTADAVLKAEERLREAVLEARQDAK